MTEKAMSELKPCPRCGNAKIFTCLRAYTVQCDCPEWFDTEAEAIAAWNRREPDWQELARELATAIAKLRAANASTVMDPRYTYVRSSRVLMDAYVDLAGVESKARKAGLLEER